MRPIWKEVARVEAIREEGDGEAKGDHPSIQDDSGPAVSGGEGE